MRSAHCFTRLHEASLAIFHTVLHSQAELSGLKGSSFLLPVCLVSGSVYKEQLYGLSDLFKSFLVFGKGFATPGLHNASVTTVAGATTVEIAADRLGTASTADARLPWWAQVRHASDAVPATGPSPNRDVDRKT